MNGLLLGGLLALLSLGLNLVFGVIDVVWICYAELIMCGMYAVYYLHVQYHWPLLFAMPAAVLVVAALGAALHQFVIRPVLSAEPINQLLVTGGVLFFLQAAATLAFGIEFKNLGVTLPSVRVGEISFSGARLIAFGVALAGMVGLYLFLSRTYLGTAIRAISQDRAIMPLMGVSPARIFAVTSALAGALAGLAACLLVLQYDVHPPIGLSFGPITFLICVLGGLGSMAGGFVAAFVFAQFISVGGFFFHLEWGYVIAFAFFIAMMFWRPQASSGGAEMIGNYPLHLTILVLLWGYIYTSWALMGRLGMVSFGHGAFMGIGAYTVVMLWNHFGLSPWLGAPAALAFAALVALAIGYPCFRFKIVGHYFALVTLALSEVVRLLINALRDQTGGSLGVTPDSALHEGAAVALGALQFSGKWVWLCIVLAFWLFGLWVWRAVDRGMARLALQAIAEEEEAAASIGIHVTRAKLRVTLISALMTCAGGVLYAQYQLYVNPDTVSGIGISLQMVFGAIAGGMFVMLGPTVGAAFTLLLAEGLRLAFGNRFPALDLTLYGAMLVLFIIYLPKGILGAALDAWAKRRAVTAPGASPSRT